MADRAVDVDEVIATANVAFVDAVRRGDADAIAAGYTVDARLAPADAADVAGRDAIRAMWAHILDHGVDDVRVDTAEVFAANGMAVEVGVLTALAQGRSVFVERFHALWVNGDAGWQIHRQIWNVQYE